MTSTPALHYFSYPATRNSAPHFKVQMFKLGPFSVTDVISLVAFRSHTSSGWLKPWIMELKTKAWSNLISLSIPKSIFGSFLADECVSRTYNFPTWKNCDPKIRWIGTANTEWIDSWPTWSPPSSTSRLLDTVTWKGTWVGHWRSEQNSPACPAALDLTPSQKLYSVSNFPQLRKWSFQNSLGKANLRMFGML